MTAHAYRPRRSRFGFVLNGDRFEIRRTAERDTRGFNHGKLPEVFFRMHSHHPQIP
jgi:hypothetical protein